LFHDIEGGGYGCPFFNSKVYTIFAGMEQTLKDIAAKHGWRKSMPFGMGAAIHCDFYKWFDTDHVVTNYDEAKQCNTEAEGVYHVYTVGKQPTKRKITKEALTQISPELLKIIVP
jgi:hypothetical protein